MDGMPLIPVSGTACGRLPPKGVLREPARRSEPVDIKNIRFIGAKPFQWVKAFDRDKQGGNVVAPLHAVEDGGK